MVVPSVTWRTGPLNGFSVAFGDKGRVSELCDGDIPTELCTLNG